MLNYRVRRSDQAAAQIRALSPRPRRLFNDAVRELARDPRGGNAKKLNRYETLWRFLIGGWRIIFSVDVEARIVTILRIGRRRTVYDDLDDLERRPPRAE